MSIDQDVLLTRPEVSDELGSAAAPVLKKARWHLSGAVESLRSCRAMARK